MSTQKPRSRTLRFLYFGAIFIALCIMAIIGARVFIFNDHYIRTKIIEESAKAGVPIQLEKLKLSVLSGNLNLENLHFKDPKNNIEAHLPIVNAQVSVFEFITSGFKIPKVILKANDAKIQYKHLLSKKDDFLPASTKKVTVNNDSLITSSKAVNSNKVYEEDNTIQTSSAVMLFPFDIEISNARILLVDSNGSSAISIITSLKALFEKGDLSVNLKSSLSQLSIQEARQGTFEASISAKIDVEDNAIDVSNLNVHSNFMNLELQALANYFGVNFHQNDSQLPQIRLDLNSKLSGIIAISETGTEKEHHEYKITGELGTNSLIALSGNNQNINDLGFGIRLNAKCVRKKFCTQITPIDIALSAHARIGSDKAVIADCNVHLENSTDFKAEIQLDLTSIFNSALAKLFNVENAVSGNMNVFMSTSMQPGKAQPFTLKIESKNLLTQMLSGQNLQPQPIPFLFDVNGDIELDSTAAKFNAKKINLNVNAAAGKGFQILTKEPIQISDLDETLSPQGKGMVQIIANGPELKKDFGAFFAMLQMNETPTESFSGLLQLSTAADQALTAQIRGELSNTENKYHPIRFSVDVNAKNEYTWKSAFVTSDPERRISLALNGSYKPKDGNKDEFILEAQSSGRIFVEALDELQRRFSWYKTFYDTSSIQQKGSITFQASLQTDLANTVTGSVKLDAQNVNVFLPEQNIKMLTDKTELTCQFSSDLKDKKPYNFQTALALKSQVLDMGIQSNRMQGKNIGINQLQMKGKLQDDYPVLLEANGTVYATEFAGKFITEFEGKLDEFVIQTANFQSGIKANMNLLNENPIDELQLTIAYDTLAVKIPNTATIRMSNKCGMQIKSTLVKSKTAADVNDLNVTVQLGRLDVMLPESQKSQIYTIPNLQTQIAMQPIFKNGKISQLALNLLTQAQSVHWGQSSQYTGLQKDINLTAAAQLLFDEQSELVKADAKISGKTDLVELTADQFSYSKLPEQHFAASVKTAQVKTLPAPQLSITINDFLLDTQKDTARISLHAPALPLHALNDYANNFNMGRLVLNGVISNARIMYNGSYSALLNKTALPQNTVFDVGVNLDQVSIEGTDKQKTARLTLSGSLSGNMSGFEIKPLEVRTVLRTQGRSDNHQDLAVTAKIVGQNNMSFLSAFIADGMPLKIDIYPSVKTMLSESVFTQVFETLKAAQHTPSTAQPAAGTAAATATTSTSAPNPVTAAQKNPLSPFRLLSITVHQTILPGVELASGFTVKPIQLGQADATEGFSMNHLIAKIPFFKIGIFGGTADVTGAEYDFNKYPAIGFNQQFAMQNINLEEAGKTLLEPSTPYKFSGILNAGIRLSGIGFEPPDRKSWNGTAKMQLDQLLLNLQATLENKNVTTAKNIANIASGLLGSNDSRGAMIITSGFDLISADFGLFPSRMEFETILVETHIKDGVATFVPGTIIGKNNQEGIKLGYRGAVNLVNERFSPQVVISILDMPEGTKRALGLYEVLLDDYRVLMREFEAEKYQVILSGSVHDPKTNITELSLRFAPMLAEIPKLRTKAQRGNGVTYGQWVVAGRPANPATIPPNTPSTPPAAQQQPQPQNQPSTKPKDVLGDQLKNIFKR